MKNLMVALLLAGSVCGVATFVDANRCSKKSCNKKRCSSDCKDRSCGSCN